MTADAIRIKVLLADNDGQTAVTGFWVPAVDFSVDSWDTDLGPLFDAIGGATAMKLVRASATLTAGLDGYSVTTGQYYGDNQDKAFMDFTNEDGAVSFSMSLPGPKATLFVSDGVNGVASVDGIDTLVAELINQLVALACDKVGKALVDLYRGWRKRKSGRDK